MGWSGPHQGFEAHVERYRNSPVMHKSALDESGELLVVHLNSFMILIEPNCPLIGLIPSAFGWKSLSREYGYGCLQGFVPGISRKHLGGQSTHVGVPVLRPGVPDCYKPMIFKNGVRKAFPRPTKKVKAPTGSSR